MQILPVKTKRYLGFFVTVEFNCGLTNFCLTLFTSRWVDSLFRTCTHHCVYFLVLMSLIHSYFPCLNLNMNLIIYNYPPKGRWIVVGIYWDAKCRGIYPLLFTDPEGDSCFSIYQIRWIKKCFFNFFFWNFCERARNFSLRSQNSEYPWIFRVTGANQNARKLLSTDLVNTNNNYYYYYNCMWLVVIFLRYSVSFNRFINFSRTIIMFTLHWVYHSVKK